MAMTLRWAVALERNICSEEQVLAMLLRRRSSSMVSSQSGRLGLESEAQLLLMAQASFKGSKLVSGAVLLQAGGVAGGVSATPDGLLALSDGTLVTVEAKVIGCSGTRRHVPLSRAAIGEMQHVHVKAAERAVKAVEGDVHSKAADSDTFGAALTITRGFYWQVLGQAIASGCHRACLVMWMAKKAKVELVSVSWDEEVLRATEQRLQPVSAAVTRLNSQLAQAVAAHPQCADTTQLTRHELVLAEGQGVSGWLRCLKAVARSVRQSANTRTKALRGHYDSSAIATLLCAFGSMRCGPSWKVMRAAVDGRLRTALKMEARPAVVHCNDLVPSRLPPEHAAGLGKDMAGICQEVVTKPGETYGTANATRWTWGGSAYSAPPTQEQLDEWTKPVSSS